MDNDLKTLFKLLSLPLEPSQFDKVGDTIPIVARKLLKT